MSASQDQQGNTLTLTEQLADQRTRLATERTLMAASRTLMAWVRTGLSQITFGFTLYKILQELEADDKLVDQHHIFTPGVAGMILLSTGVFAIIIGIAEYQGSCRKLGLKVQWQPLLMARAVGLIGLILFTAILIRA